MILPKYFLERGTLVRTHNNLGSANHLPLVRGLIENRRPSSLGSIDRLAAGFGGDIYIVKHDDGKKAAYSYDEFELA